ncbi:MAG: hypothetical protein M3Z24_08965 [Chloroflexota bacterium]|nr:hypothetical protein [Chloroflexota bacterium]
MKAAVVALILVIAAIAVLWFANTLNSWVLGGLIGGLAALLISIPISVTLFVHLSHQHDERLKREAEEDVGVRQSMAHPARPVAVYEAEAYPLLTEQEDEENYEEEYRAIPRRNLPAPIPSASYQRAPAPAPRQTQQHAPPPRQQQQVSSRSELVARPHSTNLASAQRSQAQERDLPAARGRGAPVRRAPAPKPYHPGFPLYARPSERSQQQTSALRGAQREAMQRQSINDISAYPPKRQLDSRSKQQNEERPLPSKVPNTSRQLTKMPGRQYQPRRTVDSTPSTSNGRYLPGRNETSAHQTGYAQSESDETEYTSNRHPNTDQIRYSPQTGQTDRMRRPPQTGQTTRNPRLDPQQGSPDTISGSIKNPLVRRAPYMYEDDPLRQELAQRIDAPAVRRSSRLRQYEEEDE